MRGCVSKQSTGLVGDDYIGRCLLLISNIEIRNKFKIQKFKFSKLIVFGHLNFSHSILFRILCFGFRVYSKDLVLAAGLFLCLRERDV